MTSPIQPNKTYGVLHTESFFSFLGFAKKVGSDEIQKVDVFLDDKLIDTIEANEFIQKIDDMYDVESKAFTYNLPTQYIGKKAIISFKNHDSGEELLNSPYTLIDKTHEKFNEAKFLHSLSEPLSEELKNMYKPNCVGFLATKENLEDEEFVGYIKELIERFPNVEFKGFCFNKKQISKIKNLDIQIVHIISYTEIIKNISIFITPLYLNNVNSLLIKLIITNSQILINYYSKEFATKNIDTFNKELESDFMKMRKYGTIYKFLDNEVLNAQNYLFLVFKTYMNRVNDETLFDFTSLKELLYFQTIACALVSPEFPKYMSHLRNTDIKLLGVE
jgi:hypothetical protein